MIENPTTDMKTFRLSRGHALLSLVPVLCLPSGVAAAAENAPPPKTNVLFTGADLSVQHENKLYRVEDILGSDLKIHVGPQETLVPTRKGPVALQISARPKISAVSVKLDQLQSGPAYTYAHDPMRKLEEMSRSNMDIAAMQDMANAQMARDVDFQQRAATAADPSHGSRNQAAADEEVRQGQERLDKTRQQADILALSSVGERTNVAAGAHKMQVAEGNFDAMEVSFRVSSPVLLDRPYMVVLFEFHAPDAKPGVDGLVIHAQALDTIDDSPRYIRVLKGGLPVGFKFVDCMVHIYNRGAEVATNLSAKRVEMTHDETRQYLVAQYLEAHKGRTAAAAAVRGTLPRALRQRLASDQLNRIFFAKIAKDGTLLGAFADEDCGLQLEDDATLAAVSEVFFTPELQQGQPVDGVVRLRLGDI